MKTARVFKLSFSSFLSNHVDFSQIRVKEKCYNCSLMKEIIGKWTLISQMIAHFDAKHSKILACAPNVIKIWQIFLGTTRIDHWYSTRTTVTMIGWNGGLKSIASFIPTAPFDFFETRVKVVLKHSIKNFFGSFWTFFSWRYRKLQCIGHFKPKSPISKLA